MQEVGEGLHSVHENHRDALPIAILELRVPGDVDLLQLERSLFPHLRQDPSCAFAEVAAGGVEERDPVSTRRLAARGRAHA